MSQPKVRSLEEECEEIIERSGCVLYGHFSLSSGLHTARLLQLVKALQFAKDREKLGQLFIERMRQGGIHFDEIQTLVVPAIAALPFISTLQHFSELRHTRGIYVEKDSDGKIVLGRNFDIYPNERIFPFDDVTTTFTTMRATFAALDEACEMRHGKGAKPRVIAFGSFIDRVIEGVPGPEVFAPTTPYIKVLEKRIPAYTPENCPLCLDGVPVTRL